MNDAYYVTFVHRENGQEITVRSRYVLGAVQIDNASELTPEERDAVEDDVRLQFSEGWIPESTYPYDEAAALPGDDRG